MENNSTFLDNSEKATDSRNHEIVIELDPTTFMIVYKYSLAFAFFLGYLYTTQIVNLEKCNLQSATRDAKLAQLTLLQVITLTFIISIVQDTEAQPTYTQILITFGIISFAKYFSLSYSSTGGHYVLKSLLTTFNTPTIWLLKKLRVSLADPLEMINLNITLTKQRDPHSVVTFLTRTRVADIERNIN